MLRFTNLCESTLFLRSSKVIIKQVIWATSSRNHRAWVF